MRLHALDACYICSQFWFVSLCRLDLMLLVRNSLALVVRHSIERRFKLPLWFCYWCFVCVLLQMQDVRDEIEQHDLVSHYLNPPSKQSSQAGFIVRDAPWDNVPKSDGGRNRQQQAPPKPSTQDKPLTAWHHKHRRLPMHWKLYCRAPPNRLGSRAPLERSEHRIYQKRSQTFKWRIRF